jgi:trehalose 6-phosphate synthase/phosphatase
MPRTLIVSNRLPLSVDWEDGSPRLLRSAGGLATGLDPIHARGESLWIGWPGPTEGLGSAERDELAHALAKERFEPVFLGAAQVEAYYERFSNGLLWPLMHDRLDQPVPEPGDWQQYSEVNERFAEIVAAHWREGDLVWVHDYQLLLVPSLLRRRIPAARIGFFLHIPFPVGALWRTLPQAREILAALLSADLVGFHTASYARNFEEALLRLLGARVRGREVELAGHTTRVGVFPMGIDARAFSALADEKETLEVARRWRKGDKARWLVGIDRLDYTKGIPGRLQAFERLLSLHPELRGKVRYVQVAVPSRGGVEAYQRFRSLIEELIGRIQGTFGIPDWSPVRYLHRSLDRREVVALYRAADVLLVTPVRDGMNLVAKEFAASRNDEDGVLVLSEFAGAAAELTGAIDVSPYDVEGSASAIHSALQIPREERRRRMRELRGRVFAFDGARWAADYLSALESCRAPVRVRSPNWLEQAHSARELCLLLDYDGTLVEFRDDPQAAVPDEELLDLLQRLAERPHTRLHVVSGRARGELERWLGELPLCLHAEHGLWSRPRGAAEWTRLPVAPLPARAAVREILEEVRLRVPGSLVEEKEESLVFHWRASEARFAERQVRELELSLRVLVGGEGVRIQRGAYVLEVRNASANKSLVVPAARAAAGEGALLLAIGDDATDEDLFEAVRPQGVAIKVGDGESCADARLEDVTAVRRALAGLLG